MSDKEKFQRVFDKLHASPDVLTEVLNMTTDEKVVPIRKKRFIPKVAVAIAALVLVVGSGSAAYAMDLGGIQRIVQVWIHGDQTDATFIVENGSYTLDYKDAYGNDVHQGGGGVAYENGSERPLTDEELLEQLSMPDVKYKEDGTVWIYYLNQKMEITDKFENDICYVKLKVDGKIQYITVKYQNGFAISPHGYVQPSTFD
ncbi:MAG: hypothetical protein PUI16_09220 [Clostridia bacterium]|nr:hypothetical protein [Clostridia bacterium]MDY5553876.1 hypothetical protein [Blautia sp.]